MTNLNILACISRVVLAGDERAFGEIVRTYQEPLRRFFVVQTGGDDYLADELTQETFIRVWQNLNSFKRLAAFSTWLYRVAYNVWLAHLRQMHQEYQNIAYDDALPEAEAVLQTDAIDQMAQKERQLWVTRSLAQMQDPGKTVLTLFYLQDLSVREISSITHISQDNVRAILSRGRKKLKGNTSRKQSLPMKKNNIELDPQLTGLLKGSFAARTPDETEQLTRQIMRSLPQRRRKPLLTMLLAYIQSPYWLVTAVIFCLCILGLRLDSLTAHIDSAENLFVVVAFVSFGSAILAMDMLRDTNKIVARSI